MQCFVFFFSLHFIIVIQFADWMWCCVERKRKTTSETSKYLLKKQFTDRPQHLHMPEVFTTIAMIISPLYAAHVLNKFKIFIDYFAIGSAEYGRRWLWWNSSSNYWMVGNISQNCHWSNRRGVLFFSFFLLFKNVAVVANRTRANDGMRLITETDVADKNAQPE